MGVCKQIAAVATRDFERAPLVKERLEEFLLQLTKGHVPDLQPFEEDGNGEMFNVLNGDDSAVICVERIRNTGRTARQRFKRSGEVARKSGKKSKKHKNKNAVPLGPKKCGLCHYSKLDCPRQNCLRKHRLLMHKRDYPWVLSCNIPNVSEIDQSCVNDGAFSHLWQHILLQNMYVDKSGYM